jgi:hypothetical protein
MNFEEELSPLTSNACSATEHGLCWYVLLPNEEKTATLHEINYFSWAYTEIN